MSTFVSAMDKEYFSEKKGINGSDVYSEPIGKEQELLALFGILNRNLKEDSLLESLERAFYNSNFVDLVVLAFYTRDIRGGKGEKDLFYHMFCYLFEKNPDKLLLCLEYIPFYGCWKDFQKLLEKNNDELLKNTIIDIYIKQLKKDLLELNDFKLSLVSKWAPREGKQWDSLAKEIAKKMYPSKDVRYSLKMYRKTITSLNKRIDTTEIKMCHNIDKKHRFSEICPSKVPSKCLKIKKKAFLFENKKSKDTNISYEDNIDRNKCKENFETHTNLCLQGYNKLNGKTLMPHEFSIEFSKNLSENEQMILEAQWINLRNFILEKGSLGKIVVMCDVSGSMDTCDKIKPMDVSLGLGLLCAECASESFRNRILTFESTPNWVDLSNCSSLHEKYNKLKQSPWGGSTNFEGAIEMILNTLVKYEVPMGEEPNILLCITDMGFNEATNNTKYGFQTHIERIQKDFKEKGDWTIPTIVIWNVSGEFKEFHHESETQGVCTISGWSPTILKYFMSGENVIEKIKNLTPHKMMREVLDDFRYNKIRDLFHSQ